MLKSTRNDAPVIVEGITNVMWKWILTLVKFWLVTKPLKTAGFHQGNSAFKHTELLTWPSQWKWIPIVRLMIGQNFGWNMINSSQACFQVSHILPWGWSLFVYFHALFGISRSQDLGFSFYSFFVIFLWVVGSFCWRTWSFYVLLPFQLTQLVALVSSCFVHDIFWILIQ